MKKATPATPKKRDNTLSNPNVVAAALGRRLRDVVVVEGIRAEESQLLPVEEFKRLNIDERYQRLAVKPMVNDLVHVLKSGGRVYNDVALCRRVGDARTLWIVDGQQRYHAHELVGLPMPVIIYESDGWEAEAQLFHVLNNRATVNANVIVKGHRGPAGDMLRAHAESVDGPYYCHVDFGAGGGTKPYSAFILLKGMLAAAAGVAIGGRAPVICLRADRALTVDPDAKARAEMYLRLVPLVFPPGKATLKLLPAVALGRVGWRRWSGGGAFPPPGVYEKLKRCNWDTLVANVAGGNNARFLVVYEQHIEKLWRG